MAESIIRTLLEITAYSGIIWAATMLFKRIFRRKMSPALHVAVWTLFILRLLIPVTWESGIRLAPVPEQAVREAAPSANPAPERFFSGASPAGLSSGESAKTPVSKGAGTGEPAAILGAAPVAAQGPDVWETLTFVWIAGAGVMIALSLSGYRKLRRQVFELELPCPARLEELFEECRRELGVSERVSLVVQRRLAGPALMFPDVVVLPESALLLGSDRLRMALRHELAHYRRKDQIKAVLLSALRAVYWFNPFVWLAAREIREDIETACDGTVVSGLSSSSRAFYAQTVLFLFGRGEGAVLGMASGGARKNAERRIRGIYLSKKSRGATRLSAVLLAACVGLCCFTTACQPTPDAQAVAQVSRIEGDGTQETDDTPRYQPAAYKAEGCWQDASSENDGRFTVSADVDVLIPEVEKHPIQKLTRRTFTEDEARKLTDYLAAQAGVTGDFYRLPLQMTKAEYEDQIVALRETLAMDEQNGADEDAIQADRDSIAALEEKWREAPEEASRIPATMEFAYAIDYEGNPITEDGERFIDAGAATQDGTVATVSVRSGPLGEGDPDGAAFTFSTGSWRDELTDRQALADASAERESLAEFEGPREDEIERIDAVEAAVNKRMEAYESSPVSLETAQTQAQKVMEDLGISGVQITQARQALFAPGDGSGESPGEDSDAFATPAAYVAFQRECGGVPCFTQQYVSGQSGNLEGMYSAPFYPEEGYMVLNQDGRVLILGWTNPALVAETVAADAEILPFDEVKDAAFQQLYFTVSDSENPEKSEFSYEVTDARLISTYANAEDDPDASLAIPAWCVTATGEGTLYNDPGAPETPIPMKYVDNQVIISAVDGTPVLMPNSIPLSEGGGD